MKQNAERIKLVVLNEHTLGFIFPRSCYEGEWKDLVYINILHASVLKGAVNTTGPILVSPLDKVRLASEKDFDNFNVSFKGYDNEQEYEFVTNTELIS